MGKRSSSGERDWKNGIFMEMCMTADSRQRIHFGLREWVSVIGLMVTPIVAIVTVTAMFVSMRVQQDDMLNDLDSVIDLTHINALQITAISSGRFTPEQFAGLMRIHSDRPHVGAVTGKEFDRVVVSIETTLSDIRDEMREISSK